MRSLRGARRQAGRDQQGTVLFVCLVILLVLSLAAVSTANNALLENKMVSATRNMQLANFAAGSAMSEARVRISETAVTYGAAQVCSRLRCLVLPPGAPYDAREIIKSDAAQASINVFRTDLSRLAGADESSRLAASPSYVIEDLGARAASPPGGPVGPELHSFRIIARGLGGRPDFDRVIESILSIAN